MKFIAVLVLTCLFSFELSGQNVWNDDSLAVAKADTMLINIDSQMYRKVVSVTYTEISQEMLRQEFQRIKENRKQVLQREQSQIKEMALRRKESKNRLSASQSFYDKAAKQLLWSEAVIDSSSISPPTRRQARIRELRVNPRRQ